MNFKRIYVLLRHNVSVVFEDGLSVANKCVVRHSKTMMMDSVRLQYGEG